MTDSFKIILRSLNLNRYYSITIPLTYKSKNLKNFIKFALKDELKLGQFKLLTKSFEQIHDDTIISNLFTENESAKIILVVPITLPLKNAENANSDTTAESGDFDKLEMILFHSYQDLVSKNINTNSQLINKLPLMNPTMCQRVKQVNERNRINLSEIHNPDNIDIFNVRDYFKFEIFFKLFMFFIIFGPLIKGYNIPFFISVLVIYYWYCLYADINVFYEKKILELKLTDEELKELKLYEYENLNELNDDDSERENEEEKEEEEKVEIEPLVEKNGIVQEDIQNADLIADDIQIENLSNDKILPNEKSPMKSIELQNFENEPEGISHIITKFEKKTKKEKKKEKEEGIIKYYLLFGVEIVYTFFMSLIPVWCDEYEIMNPIITRPSNPVVTNVVQELPPTDNDTTANKEQVETQLINNEEPGCEHNFSNHEQISNSSFNFNDIKFIHEKNTIEQKSSQFSEKILIKSITDTRFVNPSEDHNNKYFLVEENESRTENEYVFSENINIDTLSYNDHIKESYRNKYVKDENENEKN